MDLIPEKQLSNKNNLSNEEINQIRQNIRKRFVIYTKSELWWQLFEQSYNEYKNIFPEQKDFAKIIFGLSSQEFEKLKNGELVEVFSEINESNMKLNESVIEQIRECLIMNGYIPEYVSTELQIPIEKAEEYINQLINSKVITMEECGIELVKRMYRANKSIDEIYYEVWLEQNVIDEVIQGEKKKDQIVTPISKKLKEKNIVSKSDLNVSPKKISKPRKKKTETKEFQNLEKRIHKILSSYYYNNTNVSTIERYIDILKSEYGVENFPEDKIDLLEKCIEFALCGFNDIEFFTQICIRFMQYERAIKCITNNIDNKDESNKKKLIEMKKQLEYSVKKEKIVNMILDGNTDTRELAESTGVSECDIISIKKSILARKKENTPVVIEEKGEEK